MRLDDPVKSDIMHWNGCEIQIGPDDPRESRCRGQRKT